MRISIILASHLNQMDRNRRPVVRIRTIHLVMIRVCLANEGIGLTVATVIDRKETAHCLFQRPGRVGDRMLPWKGMKMPALGCLELLRMD